MAKQSKTNLVLAVLFLITTALGAAIGYRVQQLRESEMFYRWILGAATQYRMFSDFSAVLGPDETPKMDKEMFTEVAAKMEGLLPQVPEVKDKAGNPQFRLVTAVDSEESEFAAYSKQIWDLVRSEQLAPERARFLKLMREKKLSSVESEFNAESIYATEGTSGRAAYTGQGGAVSLGNIFFGFRKVAANFVWLQVDRYWHQGYIQRMVPLMKTCVMLDPSFVDAYLLGAWHLAFNATAKMPDTPEPQKKWDPRHKARVGEKESYYYMAVDFLQDGIHKNPRNYRLYFDLGFGIYNLKLKDYAKAVENLSKAIRCRHDVWVPRMLYICLEKNKQYAEAIAGWTDYLEKNQADPDKKEKALRFIARNTGLLKEQQADAAMERAKTETDPAAIEAAKAEAEKLRQEAAAIWQQMAGANAEEGDPFAVGRLMRMRAIKLMEQGRYLEAVAVLENARWKSSEFFEEASDMIIAAKQKAGIPLSISEQKAVLRKEEELKYRQQAETVES